MSRRCACCGETKRESSFPFKNRAEGRRGSYCHPCSRERFREYHRNNGDKERLRSRKKHKRRRAMMAQLMHDYLSDKSCVKCGVKDPRVLEFDHIKRHRKEHSISQLLKDASSWVPVQKEIAKCRILCANCHRIHTAEQMGWRKHELVKAKLG